MERCVFCNTPVNRDGNCPNGCTQRMANQLARGMNSRDPRKLRGPVQRLEKAVNKQQAKKQTRRTWKGRKPKKGK